MREFDVDRVLWPTDFGDASIQALDTAASLSRRFGAEVVGLHVLPPVPMLPHHPMIAQFDTVGHKMTMENNAAERLERVMEQGELANLETTAVVVSGPVTDRIVDVADEREVDIIVIATHGQTGLGRLVSGSVTEKVIRTSTRPVLAIQAHGK
jgi:nucleotide-binding universal stress UspA family protein